MTYPSNLMMTQGDTTPFSPPPSGSILIYVKTNGTLYTLNSSGIEAAVTGGGGAGTVTTLSVVTANGVSGTVSNPTTTPAITFTLGTITPTSVAATGTAPLTVTSTTPVANLSIGGNAATATASTNITGGLVNKIAYQTAANTTSFIAAPTTASTYLSWNGSTFVWSSVSGGNISETLDSNSNVINLLAPTGLPIVTYGTIVSTNYTVVPAAFDTVLKCSSGVVITIPSDSTLGITDTTGVYMPTINVLWYGSAEPTLSTSAVTMLGTQRSISQYGIYSIMRIGTNQWIYL